MRWAGATTPSLDLSTRAEGQISATRGGQGLAFGDIVEITLKIHSMLLVRTQLHFTANGRGAKLRHPLEGALNDI